MKKSTRFLLVAVLIFWDILSVALSIYISFQLRAYDGMIPYTYRNNMPTYIIMASVILILSSLIFGCYRSVWANAGLREAVRQLFSVTACGVVLFCADRAYTMIFGKDILSIGMPFQTIIIMCLILYFLTIFARISVRMVRMTKAKVLTTVNRSSMTRVLIFGCGEAGSYLINKLNSNPQDGLIPVVGLDSNEQMWNRKIHGVCCYGGNDKLGEAIEKFGVEEVIVAIPSASRELLHFVLDVCKEYKCSMKRFGTLSDINNSNFSSINIKNINLEELLRRDSIHLNMNVVRSFVEGKTVLVTGGCGSIGSEICRQVLSFGCAKLLIFDNHENGLFFIDNELKETYDPSRYITLLGSIRDRKRMHEVFEQYKPQLVFHAAAHKHVPMMEINPREAIKNNVFGTINVAQEAIIHGVEKFILISTDKAVNPTNIMGASKRIAEKVIQMFNRLSETDFAAVRFGNVLGSNGSVVPFFQKQIEKGGPVTVTHKEMRRYFMTIPEAVQLVLEAGAMANGEEIFVLEMGQPVLIYDLACDLIKLSGLEPNKDIKIEITGLRPGEKLFEEISLAEEDVAKTPNEKIWINKPAEYDYDELAQSLKVLEDVAFNSPLDDMFGQVQHLVPTFHHNKGEVK